MNENLLLYWRSLKNHPGWRTLLMCAGLPVAAELGSDGDFILRRLLLGVLVMLVFCLIPIFWTSWTGRNQYFE